jgi:hypothetical protein
MMMMMNEKQQVADDVWKELEGDSLATGLVVRRFPISTHTVWLVQVRPSGQLQLSLLASPSMSRDAVLEQLPTVRGLEYIFAPFDAYEHVLHIRVSDSALNEQFKAMTQDLLTSLVLETSNSVQVVAKRLLLWQKMFKRLNEKLNDNEVLGLFGELHILHQLCEVTENPLNALVQGILYFLLLKLNLNLLEIVHKKIRYEFILKLRKTLFKIYMLSLTKMAHKKEDYF